MFVFFVVVNRRHQELGRASSCIKIFSQPCWSRPIHGSRMIMDKVLCVKAGWWGHQDSGITSVSHCVLGREIPESKHLLAENQDPGSRLLGTLPPNREQEQLVTLVTRAPVSMRGLHMGSSSPRCSLGTHLLSPKHQLSVPSWELLPGRVAWDFSTCWDCQIFLKPALAWGNQTTRGLIQSQTSGG